MSHRIRCIDSAFMDVFSLLRQLVIWTMVMFYVGPPTATRKLYHGIFQSQVQGIFVAGKNLLVVVAQYLLLFFFVMMFSGAAALTTRCFLLLAARPSDMALDWSCGTSSNFGSR